MSDKDSSNDNNDVRPMTGIESPEENDVPMGRGGFVNSHKGHRRYLQMVQDRQLEYVTCKKVHKMKIAWSIVRELRGLEPPARFLRKDPTTGLWDDVGDKKFREKVSQALREHQPFIKAVIETNGDDPEPLCTTRPSDMDSVQNLVVVVPKTSNKKPQPSSKTIRDTDGYYNSENLLNRTPSIPVTENKRRAFSTTRNETNVNQILQTDDDGPEHKDVGFNLSEFSVSQGPSFPDILPEESISVLPEESMISVLPSSSRRNSSMSGLEGLWDILKDHDDLEELTGNVSNLGLSPNDTADGGRHNSLDNERILPVPPLAIHDFDEPSHHHRHYHTPLKKRSSESSAAESYHQYSEYDNYEDGLYYNNHPVKRCVLSRDKSEVSRKIKEAYYCGGMGGQPHQAPLAFDDDNQENLYNDEQQESLLSVFEKNFPLLTDHYY